MKRLICIIILLACGCSQSRPYTKSEKMWFAANVIAQCADVYTTHQALDRGGVETNPILGEKPNLTALISLKLVYLGGVYLLGEWIPESRNIVNPVSTVGIGYVSIKNHQAER